MMWFVLVLFLGIPNIIAIRERLRPLILLHPEPIYK